MAESKVHCWWQPAVQVALADGMLVFPRVPNAPGVYRFTLSGPAGTRVYVGESQRLPGRFQHYRTPGGPGEQRTTKFRLNRLMLDALTAGGRVTVEIATQAEAVAGDGTRAALNLSQKADRHRAERAVEAAERASGAALLNK
jgi:hypothetical protein